MGAPEAVAEGPGVEGLVSVVIPTFNRAYVLGEAIESVLAQSYPHIEVEVADDGSRDDTERVARSFGPRVRYVYQENGGVSSARNLGFRHARGEFIALLDSDDRWLPWKLEAQLAVLRAIPGVGMVWTDMVAVTESGAMHDPAFLRHYYSAHQKVRIEEALAATSGALGDLWPGAPEAVRGRPFYSGDLFSPILLGNLVHTSTVLLTRERLQRIGGFDEDLRGSGEDYEFHVRTCAAGPVAFLDASGIHYRIGAPDQLTAPHYIVAMARNNLTTVLRWQERGGARISLPASVMAGRVAESYAWLGEEQLRAGSSLEARGNLLKAMRTTRPTLRRSMLLLLTLMPAAAREAVRRGRRRLLGRPAS
jgi:GT2 family glycosyltransferase